MLPTDVVGVIAVGVDGRVVTAAKARVPFLAKLTGQGVASGDTNPPTTRLITPVVLPHPFDAVRLRVNTPGLFGMPEMLQVLVLKVKPWGSALQVKLVGL